MKTWIQPLYQIFAKRGLSPIGAAEIQEESNKGNNEIAAV